MEEPSGGWRLGACFWPCDQLTTSSPVAVFLFYFLASGYSRLRKYHGSSVMNQNSLLQGKVRVLYTCLKVFEVPVAMLSSSSTALQTPFFMGRVKLTNALGNPEMRDRRSYLKTLWASVKAVHEAGCLYYQSVHY